jgi:hypothetical protein
MARSGVQQTRLCKAQEEEEQLRKRVEMEGIRTVEGTSGVRVVFAQVPTADVQAAPVELL